MALRAERESSNAKGGEHVTGLKLVLTLNNFTEHCKNPELFSDSLIQHIVSQSSRRLPHLHLAVSAHSRSVLRKLHIQHKLDFGKFRQDFGHENFDPISASKSSPAGAMVARQTSIH